MLTRIDLWRLGVFLPFGRIEPLRDALNCLSLTSSVPFPDHARWVGRVSWGFGKRGEVMLALISEARAIEGLEHEIDAAEEAAYDRRVQPDRPRALNARPDDHVLLRPLHRTEFDEPDIRELRRLVEDVEKLGPDTIINQAVVREIKTRGREIVDAWDSYRAARDGADEAVDLPEIRRQGKELNERRIGVWSQIAATPAHRGRNAREDRLRLDL